MRLKYPVIYDQIDSLLFDFRSDSRIKSISCLWVIDKLNKLRRNINGANDEYLFWNLRYGEPMYASSNFFSLNKNHRDVYTWYETPDSQQFVWNLEC